MADDATPEQPAPDAAASKPYHDYHQQEADKHQQQALVDARVAADVLTNPRYDAFFAPYQPAAREQFVHDYVSRRHLWAQFGDFYERHLTGQLTQFEEEAYERLWDIQQKKLFDLQCVWRAEQATVPGVETSADFDTLGSRIENCTAIPLITPEELDLYLAWVEQADYEQQLRYHRATRYYSARQYYEDAKRELDRDPDAPDEDAFRFDEASEWYEFHNQHTGTGRLLALPDLRGSKEKRYLNAWRAHNHALREAEVAAEAEAAAAAPVVPPDPRPARLSYYEAQDLLGAFAQQFEPAVLNRQRVSYEAANPPSTWEDEELAQVLRFLDDVEEPVPIAAGDDWRLAVRQASYAYRKQKLLTSLPQAYEAYCQRQEWGIAQPACSDDDDDDAYSIASWYNDAIRAGRKLLGEPEDLDF